MPTIKRSRPSWAIQLSNTEYRTWNDSATSSKLTFHWETMRVSGLSPRLVISRAVTAKTGRYNTIEISRIVDGIFFYSRLRILDRVLAVSGKRTVQKAGIVVGISWMNQTHSNIEIQIEWIKIGSPREAEINIFDSKVEIEMVSSNILKHFDFPAKFFRVGKHRHTIKTHDTGIYKGAACGSESWVYGTSGSSGSTGKRDNPGMLFSAKVVTLREDFESTEFPELPPPIESISEKEEKGGKISLIFGTNRNKTEASDVNDHFGDEFGDLIYGLCDVNIPRGHVQGEVERPLKLWFVEFPEREGQHVVLKTITEKGEQQFFTDLSRDVSQLSEKAAMIFIHGFNNTFADAARRAAQIAWDIPFRGIPGFYSWPSCGRALSYFKDIEQADATINHFEKFIERLISDTGIEKLHLIAHSMGSRLLSFTLKSLSNKQSIKQKLDIINQIVLAAPDIDQNVFKNTILPEIKNVGKRRTLYTSDRDQALHISEDLRGGLPRLGDAGNSIFVADGLDTIDASNVQSGSNNHSYIFDEKELLTDLFLLLNKGDDPPNRRLRPRKKNSLTYWLFPK